MEHRDEMLQIDLCGGQVRVMLCETTDTVQKCADIHRATPVCTAALGRLMTGTLMLGIMMKGEKESVTVSLKGDGPMGSLMAVADHGKVKAYADNPRVELPLREDGTLGEAARFPHAQETPRDVWMNDSWCITADEGSCALTLIRREGQTLRQADVVRTPNVHPTCILPLGRTES